MWEKTRSAILKLEEQLKCRVCDGLMKDPCSINRCDHTFCRVCATKAVNLNSKCPECGSFAWLKNLQVNRQLGNVVEFCTNLQHAIDKDVKDLISCQENDGLGNIDKDVDFEKDNNIDINPSMPEQQYNETAAYEINNGSPAMIDNDKSFNNGEDAIGLVKKGNASRNNRDKVHEEDLHAQQKDEAENEMMEPPSWPLSAKKLKRPKKVVKTYSNIKKKKLASKQKLDSMRKGFPSSDSDFEHQSPGQDNKEKRTHNSDAITSSVDGQSPNIFVYDRERVLEVENEFFRQDDDDDDDVSNDDEKDLNFNVNLDNKGRKKPVTRLRRDAKTSKEVNDAPALRSSKSKGVKRKTVSAEKEVKTTSKRKPHESYSMKRNKKGETPLHVAAIKGKYETAKELLDNGADPNIKDFAGWTPLHEACNHGRFEIVQLLLDNGAFIDIPGCDHDTPLHDAIANNRIEVAEFLITKGASLDVRNKQGMLPVDYIRSNAVREQILMAASIAQENRDTTKNETISHISREADRKPKRITHTGLTATERKSLEKCAKMLSADIVDEFDEEVTHVVSSVDNRNLSTRTMKYLLAIVTGKWIISSSWVRESLKKSGWADEEDFEVKGSPDADEFLPKKARMNATKQFPGLFDGCSFYFSGEFKSTPTKLELLEIVRLGGGKVLLREPKVETAHPLITPASPAVMKMMSSEADELPSVAYHAKPNTAQSHCTQYIIYDRDASPGHKIISTPIMCTAPTSWLIDCVARFEILEVKDV